MTGSIVLGQRFKSIEELMEAIRKYGLEQGVPYVKFNCAKAETYNKTCCPDKQMPVEQEIVIACKHYGKPQQSKHVEGKQKRGNQRTFKKFCVAKMNVCYNLSDKCHIITKLEERHCNHVIDRSFAMNNPENHRPKSDTVAKVQGLFQNEAKPHRIRDVLLNSGVLATTQDVQNLRNRWRATFKSEKTSSEEAMFLQLEKLKEEDPNSVVALYYDKKTDIIQSIFFQTSYMRESLEQYPELLIMDTTYKLCNNEIPLIVFSVVDCFGTGRISGYAINFSKTKETVTSALKVLKMGCEKLVEEVKVIYVDEAQSEIASIREVLNSEIHLSDFHVKDTFKRNSVKKLVKENWDEVEKHIMEMIHAHTKDQYEEAYQELCQAAAKESEFMTYFNKNWYRSDLVWSDYKRNESFTLGERTTGRVESHNAKIKLMVDKKFPVAEVISRLRVLNRNSSIENSQRVFNELATTNYHKYSADPVIQKIMKVNTPFVGEYLKAQYARSLAPPSDSVHQVTLETCDCKYFIQTRLICSHIFRQRRLQGEESYDHKLVPPRWTVILPSDDAQQYFNNFDIIISPTKATQGKKAMTQEERYNVADSIGKQISSLICNFVGDEFHQYINALQNFEDFLRMSERVAVVGVNGDGQPDLEQANLSINGGRNRASEKRQGDDLRNASKSSESCEKVQSQNILVADRVEQESFSVLTQSEKLKLKLPIKCPVPGGPKGKRTELKKSKSKTKKSTVPETDDQSNTMPEPSTLCKCCLNISQDTSQCFHCESLVCTITCSSSADGINQRICVNCQAARNSIPPSIVSDIVQGNMLSDEHMNRSCELLRTQFGDDIEGLAAPKLWTDHFS